MIGRRLGHYRIESVLGRGGMGEVYLAFDERLERPVAIKVLPPELVADDSARRRLRREALALSKLHHPHVAVVHDFDESDGIAFMVLERVEGESLEQRLARGVLPESEVRRIGAQIAEALAAAHASGVVHSDLKPGNVLLDERGDAKVVDFGIAKRLPGAQTARLSTTVTGAIVGTVPYMAPEQLRGQPLDARADLFSLGVVLYQMSTGRLPFPGESPLAIASEILHEEPTLDSRNRLSSDFIAIVRRCLEKDPDLRFGCAEDVAAALGAKSTVGTRRLRPVRWAGVFPPRVLRGALVVGSVIIVASGVWLARGIPTPNAAPTIRTLAVLPLEDLSRDADQEYFADGMTDELIICLSQVSALRVTSRSSSIAYKRTAKPAEQIARELDVDGLITGSVQRIGERVRVRAQLVDARRDRTVWGGSYEREAKDVLALQSEIALAIVRSVRVEVAAEERIRLSAAREVDPNAHEHYLRGRYYWNRYDPAWMGRAADEFRAAVEIAPNYAAAYAGLSDAYAQMSGVSLPTAEAMRRSRAAAQRALELDPDLSAAYASLGYVLFAFDHDWAGAEIQLKRALELNPNEPTALQAYGHFLHLHGRFDEAAQYFQRAHEIDPLSTYVSAMTLWPLNQGRRFDDAIREATHQIRADSTVWYPRFLRAQALMFAGRHEEGVREFERVRELEPAQVVQGWLGWAYAISGRRDGALRVLALLDSIARVESPSPYAFALVHVGLGEKERALDWLERGARELYDEVLFINVDPAMDPLRPLPRFQALLRELGFRQNPAAAPGGGVKGRVSSRHAVDPRVGSAPGGSDSKLSDFSCWSSGRCSVS